MINIKHKGDFENTMKFLESKNKSSQMRILKEYGEKGVEALRDATPKNSSKTANSWYYTIKNQNGKITLTFNNSNRNQGVPIAIILQYGHGTGTGGYVEGIDYINPTLKPIFESLANKMWKEVVR